MSAKFRLPSPSMAVALMALFVALGGTSYAVATGSIDGREIRNSTVRTQDLRNNDVRGKDVRSSTLGTTDIKDSSLLARDFRAGQLPAGPQGPKGDKGDALPTRWALVNEAGQIEEQSGGFTVLDAYVTNQNVYIDTGSPVSGHGLSATIAIQNKIDVDGADGDAEPNFAGEISVARCQTAAVECAPPAAKTTNAIVVSPRGSDGAATAALGRKRFYVQITD